MEDLRMNATNQLTEIASRTGNDILLLFIVLSIVIITISIPLYKAVSRTNERRRQQEMERETLILDVIKDNTKVNAGLKTLLEVSTKGCDTCKKEQLERIHSLERLMIDMSEDMRYVKNQL